MRSYCSSASESHFRQSAWTNLCSRPTSEFRRMVLRPVEIGAGHVRRGGLAGTAESRVHRGAAGVGEQVQEALALAIWPSMRRV